MIITMMKAFLIVQCTTRHNTTESRRQQLIDLLVTIGTGLLVCTISSVCELTTVMHEPPGVVEILNPNSTDINPYV